MHTFPPILNFAHACLNFKLWSRNLKMEAAEHLTRREKLEIWRREKGRTPMKRPSYVHDYSSPNGTVIHPGVPRSRPTSKREPSKNKCKPLKENVPPPKSNQRKKLSRRELLEEWLATHGSTVKKPRSHIDIKKHRRRTINHVSSDTSSKMSSKDARLALKEQFQRDIDDTVSAICSEEHVGGGDDGSAFSESPHHAESTHHHVCGPSVAQALDFDDHDDLNQCYDDNSTISPDSSWLTTSTYTGSYNEGLIPHFIEQSVTTPTVPHKKRRRQSQMPRVDSTLICQSMVIKYSMALSEPRRKRRRHPVTSSTTPDNKQAKKFLHLTPVRRSTRKNRQRCPGLSLDQELCFDSPSEAQNRAGYEGVTLIPNTTLNITSD